MRNVGTVVDIPSDMAAVGSTKTYTASSCVKHFSQISTDTKLPPTLPSLFQKARARSSAFCARQRPGVSVENKERGFRARARIFHTRRRSGFFARASTSSSSASSGRARASLRVRHLERKGVYSRRRGIGKSLRERERERSSGACEAPASSILPNPVERSRAEWRRDARGLYAESARAHSYAERKRERERVCVSELYVFRTAVRLRRAAREGRERANALPIVLSLATR